MRSSTFTARKMNETSPKQRHPHYFRSVEHLAHVDVYRVLGLFEVTDPAIAHAVKKLLLAGRRGRKAELGQTIHTDVQEAVDALQRWQEMRKEDSFVKLPCSGAADPRA
jgi:hypothetical protein